MRFIKKYLPYQIYTIISIFLLLILSGLIKYLLRIFKLFLNDILQFEAVFVSSIILYHFFSSFLFFRIWKNKNYKVTRLISVILLNYIFFFSIEFIFGEPSVTIFVLGSVLFVFIPIYIGYRFEITSKWLVKSFFLVLLVLLFRVSLSRAYPIFLQVENYDNISGIYSKEIQFKSIEFRDENGDVLFLNEDNVLLDFWTNTCGVCIKKFPKVVDVVEGLDNQPFYLVNVIDDESQMIEAKEILKQRDVSLKNIFLFKENIEKFDINYYPTVIKVENNEIVFKGMIESYVYFDFIRNL